MYNTINKENKVVCVKEHPDYYFKPGFIATKVLQQTLRKKTFYIFRDENKEKFSVERTRFLKLLNEGYFKILHN